MHCQNSPNLDPFHENDWALFDKNYHSWHILNKKYLHKTNYGFNNVRQYYLSVPFSSTKKIINGICHQPTHCIFVLFAEPVFLKLTKNV